MSEQEQTETVEMTERQVRDALKELSTNLFGSSSRWQKLRTRTVLKTTKMTQADGTEMEVAALENGIKVYTEVNMSDIEVLSVLEDLLKRRDEQIELAKQKQLEKQAAANVQKEAGGSAVNG